MTRIYAAVDAALLRRLQAGETVQVDPTVAASEDEQDEYDAMIEASAGGPVVLVAEVTNEGAPVDLSLVESFHVDLDDSGDLAWFATQEIAQVIEIVEVSE